MVAYMELQRILEELIKKSNEIISRHETDSYSTKQHLIDEIDKHLSSYIDKYDLNIEKI